MTLGNITKSSSRDIQHKFVVDKYKGSKITMKANSSGTCGCVKFLMACFKGIYESYYGAFMGKDKGRKTGIKGFQGRASVGG